MTPDVVHTRPRERALLVGVETPQEPHWMHEESLEELSRLVQSAGGEVVRQETQRLDAPTAPYYVGRGKAKELAELCFGLGIDSVIFDDELSPAQSRNLSNLFARKVLDRTQLILDIFAQRAQSREGKLQIELAQLRYLLPRLTHMWAHLSRQYGTIGTRGPGETQLEMDRRRVKERIAKLKRELEEVRRRRAVQRGARVRKDWTCVSLVGYTNAGKSTLFNYLTRASVPAEDKLFATLDPTTRVWELPDRSKVLLTDTVGFIRKLPPRLIESFKATLEELEGADLLLHVVDLSSPNYEEQIRAVEAVLDELKVAHKPTLVVFNKVDRVANRSIVERALALRRRSIAVSARTGEGIDKLLEEVQAETSAGRVRAVFRIPWDHVEVISELYREGGVLQTRYREDAVEVIALVSPVLRGRLSSFVVENKERHLSDVDPCLVLQAKVGAFGASSS
ncbi:GTPase HflX [Candidatus Methylacidithermus pantelleriae]|uniref:GTPase HflX n=1 Tax=Candidatus Methylacidithermus pantelleriae TaxID=2744239 RepID=A0A8J2BNV4_9BACT|nr:GTPase HflX [Candidatus Methylacidithermus pantelleriae]CAF0697479.1 ribosome rescue factor HflX [Candidatus Methylacidithermus pantelleriae]